MHIKKMVYKWKYKMINMILFINIHIILMKSKCYSALRIAVKDTLFRTTVIKTCKRTST